jgi:hypothetical protein
MRRTSNTAEEPFDLPNDAWHQLPIANSQCREAINSQKNEAWWVSSKSGTALLAGKA